MVFGFITIYAIGAYHHKRCEFKSRSDEEYSIQQYVQANCIDWIHFCYILSLTEI
jgi:hypothetical protein